MQLIHSTALGICTLIGWMCLVRNCRQSVFMIHVVETNLSAHLGAWNLLRSPRVLCTIAHLNHPMSSWLGSSIVWSSAGALSYTPKVAGLISCQARLRGSQCIFPSLHPPSLPLPLRPVHILWGSGFQPF